ncbi:DUF995 domain-containing protein [Planktotalea sp.]|uniref:DUF995 domain-containing protein n=1 Tax=Planktotalea sp. TaxID=2029877 RepID=UPI0035C7F838
MFNTVVKMVSQLGLTVVAISATPALAAPISPQEILALYSDSSSISGSGTNLNYYAPDGSFKTTNIKTGEAGKWYVTNTSKLCIVTKNERCWKITQTKTEVCFNAKGNRSCRAKDAYMRGDQTSAYVKK